MDRNRGVYIPALRYHWLTTFYDPLLRWTLGESTFKRQLVKQARIEGGHRVLRLGGELHLADWGRAQNSPMRMAFLLVQLLDGFETTVDNVAGLLPELIRTAGFESVQESARYMTVVGTLSLYRAWKPA